VAEAERKRGGGLAYREIAAEGEESGPPVVLVHGFPESSRMWVRTMEALARAGRASFAPDLYCLGDSDDPGPATFERNLDALGSWHEQLDLGRVALVVHDWGGFIGLAWACEHPALVEAGVISDTGFFSDGRWHGMAEAVRGEQGEQLVAALDREGFAGLLRGDGAEFTEEDVDAYWRPFEEGRGRAATLEFYRSMDFSKLERFEGRLAEAVSPALLLWGAEDKFAPVGGARRFQREIPDSELIALDGAGHFVFDQEPERCAEAIVGFLTGTEG
jgi:haloalkane dehalogenase